MVRKKMNILFLIWEQWNNIIEDFQVLRDFVMNWANQILQNSKRNFPWSYGSHIFNKLYMTKIIAT